jgi:hypothetical protein
MHAEGDWRDRHKKRVMALSDQRKRYGARATEKVITRPQPYHMRRQETRPCHRQKAPDHRRAPAGYAQSHLFSLQHVVAPPGCRTPGRGCKILPYISPPRVGKRSTAGVALTWAGPSTHCLTGPARYSTTWFASASGDFRCRRRPWHLCMLDRRAGR